MSHYTYPIARPALPTFDELRPYLEGIDTRHHYTNFGPLEGALADAMVDRLGCENRSNLAIAANGTLALQLAISHFARPDRPYCLAPSWAFRAVPEAALCAGFTPYFVDVDIDVASMCPDAAVEAIRHLGPDQVGAIILVPFMGKTIDLEPWRRIREEYGVPVVIDAAAGYCNFRCSDIPTVLSFHTTKIFSTCEGGCVLFDGDISGITDETSFGALDRERGAARGTNAKLSEYHAAIGLAFLEGWDDRLARYRRLSARYVAGLSDPRLEDIVPEPGYLDRWMTNAMPIRIRADKRQDVISTLEAAGVETRMWWGSGLHRQARYADLPSGSLDRTERIAGQSLSLPYYLDMEEDDIDEIVGHLPRNGAP